MFLLTCNFFIRNVQQLDIGAFKECVNSLSQAIAYGKDTEKKTYWLALIGYARFSYGDFFSYVEIMIKAMESLNEAAFSPQVRTQGTVDKLIREYGEFDDIPPENNASVDDLDVARLLIAFGMTRLMQEVFLTQKEAMQKQYNIPDNEVQRTLQWYRCKYT